MNRLRKASAAVKWLELAALVLFGISVANSPLQGATGSQEQKKPWPLARAYDLLFKGLYDQAVTEAEKAVVEHANDPILVSRGLGIQARASVLAGRPEQAMARLNSAQARYEKEDALYSDTYPVPMSLFLRIEKIKTEAFLHQRLGEYLPAAEAIERQILEEKRTRDYLKRNEQGPRGGEFLTEAILRSTAGDLYRYAGQYAEAIPRYEAALQVLAHYTPAREDTGPTPRVALPTDRYLKGRLPRLIEQCRDSGPTAQYARAVDWAVEIGDWHRNMGGIYTSKPDHAAALRKYREALAYLQREGLSSELGVSDRGRYSILRDETLPQLIHIEEAAVPSGSAVPAESTCTVESLRIDPGLTDEGLKSKPIGLVFPFIGGEPNQVKERREAFKKSTVTVLTEGGYRVITSDELSAKVAQAYKTSARLRRIAPLPTIIVAYLAEPGGMPGDEKATQEAIQAVGESLGIDYLLCQRVKYENRTDGSQSVSVQFDLYAVRSGSSVFQVVGTTTKGQEPEANLAERLARATLGKLPGFSTKK